MTGYAHECRDKSAGAYFVVSKMQFWITALALLAAFGVTPPIIAKLLVRQVVEEIMEKHDHNPSAHMEAIQRQYQVGHDSDQRIEEQLVRINSKLDDALQRLSSLEGANGKGRNR